MNKVLGVYAAIAALLAVVDARVHQPRATAASGFDVDGFSPKPTYAPKISNDLLRRASSSSAFTALFAPDNTCGYISGQPDIAYTCGVGGTCAFLPTSSDGPGRVACCDTNGCHARISCLDYNEIFSQSKCDNNCLEGAFTLKCTNTALPFCNTISFPGDIVDVFCNNVNIQSIQAALTTYRGQTSRSFNKIVESGTALASTTASSEASSSSEEGSATPASTSGGGDNGSGSGSNSGNGNGGNSGSGNNGGSGNSSGSSSGGGGGGGSKTPVGAIVGGVVGGVAGIALLATALFFILRRKRASPTSTEQPPPAQYQQPPMQQGQQQYYDPKFAAATTQQYPPQQALYAVPLSPDSQNPLSPNGSHSDPRFSVAQSSISPSPSGGYPPPANGFQPQEGVIHEAPAQAADHHHGQMHELA